MQNPDQDDSWSWPDARRLYYRALTEPNALKRQALWADLFRALGQVMHLVVDASVPEHARNDIHALSSIGLENSYERWVSSQHTGGAAREAQFVTSYLSAPIGFMQAILDLLPPAGEQVATVPVARLIDADQYDGTNPQVTVNGAYYTTPSSAGLAEIANANFFSEDTLERQYPSPKTAGLIPVNLTTPFGRVRRYFSRPAGQGLLPANPVRAECVGEEFYWRGEIRQGPPYPCVDQIVWRQVAAHMLPRAVGYARGVLDYFFRGSVRVHALYMEGGKTFIKIENQTDEEMNGVFEVYARPMVGAPQEGREKAGLVNGGAATTVGPHTTVTLDVTLLPTQHPTAAQILVFRGRLGLESHAVTAQIFDVPYVVITQTGQTATMSASCTTDTFFENYNTVACDWLSRSYSVTGELFSNGTVPAIARVSAAWEPGGTVNLELDGVPNEGGVWERDGDEPDPRRFRITASRVGYPRLKVTVELLNGRTVSARMAMMIAARGVAQKVFTLECCNPPGYVEAERSAVVRVTADTSYRTLSIEGYPNPTRTVAGRFGDPRLSEHVIVEQANLFEASYRQRWIDEATLFQTLPPGGPVILRQELKSQFDALAYGPPPAAPWEAVVERLYDPAELEFAKAFGTSTVPPSPFTLVGRSPEE